jgi:hypothetical protein
LEDQFREIGQNVNQNIPHIKIPTPSDRNSPPPSGADFLFNPKENEIISLIKKWGFIIAVTAVVGYAIWRLLS